MALPDDDRLLLLHNPACSKSRAALARLETSGLPFEVRPYLERPLDRAELVDLVRRLDLPAAACVRRGEPAHAASGLGDSEDEGACLDALAEHPSLLQRPVLVRGPRAVVGRPTEALEALLGDA